VASESAKKTAGGGRGFGGGLNESGTLELKKKKTEARRSKIRRRNINRGGGGAEP